jgi:hypothetical protein
MRSFIRLKQRRKVLFPLPEAPMRATTFLGGMTSETSFTARVEP